MAVLEQLESMSAERFQEIYESLAQQGFGPLDGELAKKLKFRPQAIRKLPMDKRAHHARKLVLGQKNAELAYELFGTYLMRKDKALLTDFLDATGVEHEDGMIQDIDEGTPDPEKVPAAIETLDARYPADDVTLYLAISVEHWPDIDAITEAWTNRSK